MVNIISTARRILLYALRPFNNSFRYRFQKIYQMTVTIDQRFPTSFTRGTCSGIFFFLYTQMCGQWSDTSGTKVNFVNRKKKNNNNTTVDGFRSFIIFVNCTSEIDWNLSIVSLLVLLFTMFLKSGVVFRMLNSSVRRSIQLISKPILRFCAH